MLNRIAVLILTVALFAGVLLAHGDPVMGTITAVNNDSFTIKDKANKSVVIMLEKGTKYLKNDKAAAKSDLQIGARVIIDAHPDAKTKALTAEEVNIGTAAPAAPAKK
jgi:hypothetical protein